MTSTVAHRYTLQDATYYSPLVFTYSLEHIGKDQKYVMVRLNDGKSSVSCPVEIKPFMKAGVPMRLCYYGGTMAVAMDPASYQNKENLISPPPKAVTTVASSSSNADSHKNDAKSHQTPLKSGNDGKRKELNGFLFAPSTVKEFKITKPVTGWLDKRALSRNMLLQACQERNIPGRGKRT